MTIGTPRLKKFLLTLLSTTIGVQLNNKDSHILCDSKLFPSGHRLYLYFDNSFKYSYGISNFLITTSPFSFAIFIKGFLTLRFVCSLNEQKTLLILELASNLSESSTFLKFFTKPFCKYLLFSKPDGSGEINWSISTFNFIPNQ